MCVHSAHTMWSQGFKHFRNRATTPHGLVVAESDDFHERILGNGNGRMLGNVNRMESFAKPENEQFR